MMVQLAAWRRRSNFVQLVMLQKKETIRVSMLKKGPQKSLKKRKIFLEGTHDKADKTT